MNTLEIRPQRFMSTDYAVTRNGEPLTVVRDTTGPLCGWFDTDAGTYCVQRARLAGSFLGELVRGLPALVTGRVQHALIGPDGAEIARARGRGTKDHGHDVWLSPIPAGSLQWRERSGSFAWHVDGADVGYVQRHPQTPRGVAAMLPDTLPASVQVFVGLLGLARWEFVQTGSGGE